MVRTRAVLLIFLACLGWATPSVADSPATRQAANKPAKPSKPAAAADKTADKKPSKPFTLEPAEMSVAELAAKVRESTVVVSVLDRNGERSTLGAGFIISKDGLIATNLHVIGEARPIRVALSDKRKFEVTEVHATDHVADLAIIRIKADDLKPLPLGDSDSLKPGQDVVAVGNPRGLEYSVVSGVVSGLRAVDGRSMIQLAIPIEQGNSGGPLIDRRGRVHGILTMKSIVTENLGFAVPINALKPLLSKPNPIPIERWLTIGAIDHDQWTIRMGGHWSQRAGRIVVDGPGQGFGGRTLLISKHDEPDLPFEFGAWVRLRREDGAAGLAFHFQDSNGHDSNRHYGFYPSSGRIRFTRFDGPDVYSWRILSEVQTPAYRPGEWNYLKVRFEKGKILGSVNDIVVVQSNDDVYDGGSLGLCNFRDTHAEFKGFEVGKQLPSVLPSRDVLERVERVAAQAKPDRPPQADTVDQLVREADAGVRALSQLADRREREALQLRRLAMAVRQRRVQKELSALFDKKEEKVIDLLRAGLLIARIDNDDLDLEAYVREVDRIADAVRKSLPAKADAKVKLAALDDYLFKKLGFHGSRSDYYNRSNSYLNEVIDDREGLPLTLSVIYIELARRLQVEVVGVGLPGKFLVRSPALPENASLIDVYEGGRRLTRAEAETQVKGFIQRPLTPDDWKPQRKRQIIQRLVQNLANATEQSGDFEATLRYVEILLALDSNSILDHWHRARLCFETGRRVESLEETNWLLAQDPQKLSDIVHPSQLEQLKTLLESHP